MSHSIPCSWQVPFETHEIKHQLEPGEPRPMHTREGRIIDFKPYVIFNRHGSPENAMMVIVQQGTKLLVLPMTSVTVLSQEPQQ